MCRLLHILGKQVTKTSRLLHFQKSRCLFS
jgi:hypothetical protein